MRRNRLIWLLTLLVLTSAPMLGPAPVTRSDGGTHLRSSLTPSWTTGMIGEGVGPAGIILTDLNRDNKTDILACSDWATFVLNKIEGNTYDTRWYSPYSCSKIAAGDADGDGIQEVFVGGMNGNLLIYRGDNFQRSGALALPGRLLYAGKESFVVSRAGRINSNYGDERVTGIAVADVDGDGRKELVVLGLDGTFVYDAQTLALEWNAAGMGGTHLGIGDVDGDGRLEIVVNASPGHILDAATKTEKMAFTGGFGTDMAVGDVDGDKIAEIVYIQGGAYITATIFVYEADKSSTKWQVQLPQGVVIAVGDTDRDGISEVLAGQGQSGLIVAYRGMDGAQLWSIGSQEWVATGVAVGDTDNDGANEVVWGASGWMSKGLYIGDWTNSSVEWHSDDLVGPMSVTAADIDLDGRTEIIVASRATGSYLGWSRYEGYFGGTITVYDGMTHAVEWSTMLPNSQGEIFQVVTGQLDDDPALEILAAVQAGSDAFLVVYDGISHEVEWQSQSMKFIGLVPSQVVVANLDNGPVQDIVAGINGLGVQVFRGITGQVKWDSGPLANPWITDLAVGDLDGNSVLDLAVLANGDLYVYEVGTWTRKPITDSFGGTYPFGGSGGQIAIERPNPRGAGELVIGWGSDSQWMQVLSGTDYRVLWEGSTGAPVKDMATADLDGDGDEELVLAGPGAIQSQVGVFRLLESTLYRIREPSYGVSIADVDNDGRKEVIFATYGSIEVNQVTISPLVIPTTYSTYLPALERVP